MTTIKIKERVKVIKTTDMEIVNMRVLMVTPTHAIGTDNCQSCMERIGVARPIAIVWCENRARMICNKCFMQLSQEEREKYPVEN